MQSAGLRRVCRVCEQNHLSEIDLVEGYFESGHHANFVVITQSCDLLSERHCCGWLSNREHLRSSVRLEDQLRPR